MKKYTKAMIEKAAKKIAEDELFADYNGACVFANGKLFFVKNGKLEIEEDVDPHDYCSYLPYEHVLSFCSDYFSDFVDLFDDYPTWIEKLAESIGCYIERCTSSYYTFATEKDEEEYEFTVYKERETETYISPSNVTYFPWCMPIYKIWRESVNKYGVCGSIIRGDGVHFEYKGHPFFFSTNYDQSDVTSETVDAVIRGLDEIGATDIWYDCGRMD